MADGKSKPTIVFVSTFPPQECGLATFTQDLSGTFDYLFAPNIATAILATNPGPGKPFQYQKKVRWQIDRNEPANYLKTAQKLNKAEEVKLVNIQHEFGIFGGEFGEYLTGLTENLAKPYVITLHTILPSPPEKMKDLVKKLADKASAVTVMTDLSKQILQGTYGVPEEKIYVIPHGAHAVEFEGSEISKNKLGISDRTVISTFGLLSRGKGIEYVIESLPEVVKKFPHLLYLVIGATHPQIIRQEGESYRDSLKALTARLGLEKHVKFYNKYLDLGELLEHLKATDIYISTSLNPDQAVSGTLSYALSCGRPVISTAFAQAKADLGPEIGRLVGFKDPASYTQAIAELVRDKGLRQQMGKRAYFRTRHMTWQNVTLRFMRLFSRFVKDLTFENIHLPKIKIDHLKSLTDDFGIFQFAQLNISDPKFGYTLDDNARAMIAAGLHYANTKDEAALKLVKTYLDFIGHAQKPDGLFINYYSHAHKENLEANAKDSLEDSNARALVSLARIMALKSLPKSLRAQALDIYNKRIAGGASFTFPRSMAFYIRALYYRSRTVRGNKLIEEIDLNCRKLLAFYKRNGSTDWQWFEPALTYSNSMLSEALLLGFVATGKADYFEAGKNTLDFLIGKTFLGKLYTPIGQNGWYEKTGARSYFDQQPEDAAAMVQTLKVMYQITGEENYRKLMYRAFYWFLGENSLGQFVYDCTTGGCYDGLGEDHINLNQGAESTISYLLARLSLEFDMHITRKAVPKIEFAPASLAA